MTYLTLSRLILQHFLVKLLALLLSLLDAAVWRVEQWRTRLQTAQDNQQEVER